ncbi:MAG: aminomethyl-transferring glycine dehydrogenase subunit GcvPB [Candidatus Hodarchaeota archaeon]
MRKKYQQARWAEPLIFELPSSEGKCGLSIESNPEINPIGDSILGNIPEALRRKDLPNLPQLSEIEVFRHFSKLSQMNYGVNLGMYPLGSCTMKYNPKIHDLLSSLPEITRIHPNQPELSIQGALEIIYETDRWLSELTGMDKFTLQPAAGAHGEFTGILIIRAYHEKNENTHKSEIIVPDSAHGTNPATAAMCGYDVVVIPSDDSGCVDIAALETTVSEKTAGLMITNPNTLGIFEKDIMKISKIIHNVDGQLYYDGANLNGMMGYVRPGDMGFDVVHLNIHKTFSGNHGCGGGSTAGGPVGVKAHLTEFLPVPIIEYNSETCLYTINSNFPHSIGKVRSYFGNFPAILRTYAYILAMGEKGLKRVTEVAVLNANYLSHKLKDVQGITLPRGENIPRKHEIVLSLEELEKETGVSALDVSKRLLDFGFMAPTMYFPLIIHEAMMIEPTETVSREELDNYAEAIKQTVLEANSSPETVKNAPHRTCVTRLDDVRAAHPKTVTLTWRMMQNQKELLEKNKL